MIRALILSAALASTLGAAEPVKSGPQPGDRIPAVFEPLNINGEFAGQKHCLVCENGLNPVVLVFARSTSKQLEALCAKLEASVVAQRKHELGAFAVFFGQQDDLEKPLTEMAKNGRYKHFILSIEDETEVKAYKVAADADITVILYVDHEVKANFAFKKGELTEEGSAKILGALPKILPK